MSSESEEDIYEVINIGKIKAHTPNLRVVNLYGITFLDDSHIEMLASNCIHIECLALNFCLRVKGSSFKTLIQRCKKLKSLLLQHAGKDNCVVRLSRGRRQPRHHVSEKKKRMTAGKTKQGAGGGGWGVGAVSYTHLTLPTKLSV